MYKGCFIAILMVFAAMFAQAQATRINPATLLKPGANNTILQTNGSGVVEWAAKTAAYSAGTGITVSAAGVIANSSPDQTVAITGAGASVVTGTYPNFTITTPAEILTNEGSLTVAAGTGTTSIINSNTSGSTGVTITAGTGLTINETGNVITLAATASAPTWTQEVFEVQTGATVTTTGTLPGSLNSIWVFREGVWMLGGTGEDFTVSGNVITFTNALAAERVVVRWTN